MCFGGRRVKAGLYKISMTWSEHIIWFGSKRTVPHLPTKKSAVTCCIFFAGSQQPASSLVTRVLMESPLWLPGQLSIEWIQANLATRERCYDSASYQAVCCSASCDDWVLHEWICVLHNGCDQHISESITYVPRTFFCKVSLLRSAGHQFSMICHKCLIFFENVQQTAIADQPLLLGMEEWGHLPQQF